MKSSYTNSEQNGQKVAGELVDLKKKLREQRKATSTAEGASKTYHGLLTNIAGGLDELQIQVSQGLKVSPTLEPESEPVSDEGGDNNTMVNGDK